jgi:isopropylmalate/homocitrate/citramalate synthase
LGQVLLEKVHSYAVAAKEKRGCDVFNLPKKIKVVDVSARDGLQSFPRWVDTDVKIRMVDRLSEVGFPVIEVTNFAYPRVIPHLKDDAAKSIIRRTRT